MNLLKSLLHGLKVQLQLKLALLQIAVHKYRLKKIKEKRLSLKEEK